MERIGYQRYDGSALASTPVTGNDSGSARRVPTKGNRLFDVVTTSMLYEDEDEGKMGRST